MNRADILSEVAAHILGQKLSHPTRVAIDGITASGKSTFAKELAEFLNLSHRQIIATTLDGFHNPRSRRYERGRDSAEGYYRDAYNYPAIIQYLLEPLGGRGTLNFKTRVFDLDEDVEIKSTPQLAQKDAILIVDGSFALRKELHLHWDVSIYLDVDFSVAEERASARDAAKFGSAEKAKSATRNRYHEAHKIHNLEATPAERANFVIRNSEPRYPEVLVRRF